MVQQTKEKLYKRPPNRAQRPPIWQDVMAEVKETFRRVAMVKHAGFSVWDDSRRGPTLEKILRWNRQARNLSQVPKSLREKIPPKVLKEIQNNRSVTGYVSQTHLQNVKGMCQRIHSQKSVNERRKNLYDPSMYPVFVRRPPVAACLIDASELDTSPRNLHSHYRTRRRPHSSPGVDYRAPLSYTPQPFKLLYDISNGSYPACSFAKRPRSVPGGATASVTSCYEKMFNRSPSSLSKKSVMDIAEALERQRVSSAPAGATRRQHRFRRLSLSCAPSPSSSSSLSSSPKVRGRLERRNMNQDGSSNRSTYDGESRPPSRCTNRPASNRSSWRVSPLVEHPVHGELSNRSTYSDCVSLDSLGMPVLFSSGTTRNNTPHDEETTTPSRPKVSVPKLRLRGGAEGISPRKAKPTSSALSIVERAEQSKKPFCSSVIFSSCSDEEELKLSFQQEQQRPSTVNVPLVQSSETESFPDCNNWRPQSASNAVGRRCSRVTFASPVESSRWDNTRARFCSAIPLDSSDEVDEEITAPGDEPEEGNALGDSSGCENEREEEHHQDGAEESEDVIIKHSSDPYVDFKSSMMSMIESEGLHEESKELDELFQYYLDLNPKMHHPILARVIQDIKSELKTRERTGKTSL